MTAQPAAGSSLDEDIDTFLGGAPRPWWRRNLRWLLLAGAVIVLALLLSRCVGGNKGGEYATETVRRDTLQITVSATGHLAPTDQVDVGSELSGQVVKVIADVNDRVTAGQPLAYVDPSRFADTVRQSEAQLGAAIAAEAQAQATLAQDKAQLDRLEAVWRLSGGKVPSDTDLAAGRAEYKRAAAAVTSARANIASARATLSSNRTSLVKTVIRSPVNGVVLARQIEPGQTVAASFNTPTLFVIARDLTRMKLPVSVDEADVGDVEAGQSATFTVDAFPGERFPAKITRVSMGSNQTVSSASGSSTSSAAASQVVSYEADLSVANPQLRLRPGMTATAEIVTRARPNVLLVPNAALRFTPTNGAGKQGSGGIAGALTPRRPITNTGNDQSAVRGRGAQQTVYVLESGKPRAIKLSTGASDGTWTEVLGGNLRAGMAVITGQLASGGK